MAEKIKPYLLGNIREENPWLSIFVKKFIIYPGNIEHYEIWFDDGKKIEINQDNILTQTTFRKQYFGLYGVLLPPLSQTQWCKLITSWRTTNSEIMEQFREDINVETEIKEKIINYVSKCLIISDIKNIGIGMALYKDNEVLIPSEHIQNIVKNSVSMRKINYLLHDYLKSGTKPIRIGKEVKRFWVFDPDKIGFDPKDLVNLDNDES